MTASAKATLDVTLHWYAVADDDDSRWRHDLALYAYLAPVKPEIYYLGKCDRARQCADALAIAPSRRCGIVSMNGASHIE